MYNRITIYGDLNVNYMCAKSTSEEISDASTLDKPIWDAETIALANFNSSESASSYDGANFVFSTYRIYRKDKNKDSLKYIATVKADINKIKDYTNHSNNECTYLIYLINSSNQMGTVIETKELRTSFDYWTIAGTIQTDDKNIFIVDKENIWNFWLSPEISSISQVTQKSKKTGFSRYPKIKHSDVNYASGTLSFLLGELDCLQSEYINDTVEKKNRWIEFANTPTPKVLTDPKGECMIVDITPIESNVDFNLIQTPTTIRFEFTEIADVNDITVYSEEVK